MKKIAVIITAGGRGSRMGADIPKQFLKLGEKEILEHTIDVFKFFDGREIGIAGLDIFLTLPEEYFCLGENKYGVPVIVGGDSRQESVRNAFNVILKKGYDYVLVHDAARPFIKHEVIKRVIEAMLEKNAVVPVVDLRDTVKLVYNQKIEKTVDRNSLKAAQTPQGFECGLLKRAFDFADENQIQGTDESVIVEMLGTQVHTVSGDVENFKITNQYDLKIGEMKMSEKNTQEAQNSVYNMRVGHGFDVHKIVDSRPMILGGVEISSSDGLLGHSDADVLVHAIMDAMLGAANLPDIGQYFPDSDSSYKGISSIELLKQVAVMLRQRGFEIMNIDATVIGERPKIAPLRVQIIDRISSTLEIPSERVNVKGTTTEKLGFAGRGEGLCAEAVALLIVNK